MSPSTFVAPQDSPRLHETRRARESLRPPPPPLSITKTRARSPPSRRRDMLREAAITAFAHKPEPGRGDLHPHANAEQTLRYEIPMTSFDEGGQSDGVMASVRDRRYSRGEQGRRVQRRICRKNQEHTVAYAANQTHDRSLGTLTRTPPPVPAAQQSAQTTWGFGRRRAMNTRYRNHMSLEQSSAYLVSTRRTFTGSLRITDTPSRLVRLQRRSRRSKVSAVPGTPSIDVFR